MAGAPPKKATRASAQEPTVEAESAVTPESSTDASAKRDKGGRFVKKAEMTATVQAA